MNSGAHHYLEPHYSTWFCVGFYNYLKANGFGYVFDEIVKETGIEKSYLLTDSNWVSVSFAEKMFQLAVEKTGNKDAIADFGRFLFKPESVNIFEYLLLKLLPPILFFATFRAAYRKVNRVVRIVRTRYRPGFVAFRFEHLVPPPKGFCDNVVAALESVGQLWTLGSVTVTKTKCFFHGDDVCDYSVRYSARVYWTRVLTWSSGAAFASIALAFSLTLGQTGNWFSLQALSVMSLGWVLAIAAILKVLDLFRFSRLHHETNLAKTAELHESHKKLDRRYQEANLLRELSLNLVRETNPTKLMDSVLTEIEKRFGYGRTMVMLVSADQSRLYTADVRGFGKFSELVHKLQFKYPAEKEHDQLFANILEKGETTYIENMDAFIKNLKPENQVLLMALGINSMVVAPIQDANTKYGLLVIGETTDSKQLTQDDRHLTENIARLFSVYFQNARNFEREQTLRTIFQKYVPAVVLEGIQSLTGGAGFLLPKDNYITSFFIDLRDFTSKSEGMPPEKVVELLNLYFNYVSMIVSEEGGIVDNLIGDALVAFFPAEEKRRTLHAARAMRSALRILSGLEGFNEQVRAKGFADIEIGIGVHTGNATVGSIGSDHKLNYTAIGDTVNVASRLQGLCKKLGERTPAAAKGVLVVSDQTFLRARIKSEFVWVGPQEVKGRKAGVNAAVIDVAMAAAAVDGGLHSWTEEEHEGFADKFGVGAAGEPSMDRRGGVEPAQGKKKVA